MKALPLRLLTLEIRLEHDVVLCRQRARQLAAAFGFDTQEQTRIATAVSEISRNAFDYAKGGRIEFSVETNRRETMPRKGLEEQALIITVRDRGPGLPPVEERHSPGGLGLGLKGAERLMDSIEIATRPGATAITLRKAFPAGAPVLAARGLQAVVDAITAEPPTNPLAELQRQNQELIRALDEIHGQRADVARVNQELADTNTGVLALYDELETLHRVSVLLASQLDLKTLLQAIIDATTELTEASFGAFFYRDEADAAWQLEAVAGPARAALLNLPASHEPDFFGADFTGPDSTTPSPTAEPEQTGVPCSATKFAAALGDLFELRSCLVIAVASEAKTIGAMVFGSAEAGAFNERSERIVSSIAAQAVIGIEKARLFAEVQSASSAKDRFLAMLSHELRTPLNPILAVVSELAANRELPDDARADLAVALRNIRLEARLIDDLLDFSRIISGKLQLHREIVDLHALIRNVVDICAEEVAAGSQVLTVDLEAAPTEVFGDSARLQQVFWNVLKNAFKFTPAQGHITVRTSGAAAGTITTTITDDGVGIDDATLADIFDAFEQGGTDTTARFGGLGLGLAISKAFVELHGGTIRADSAGPGQGTQISVSLPLLARDHAPAAPTAAPAPEAAAAPAIGTLLLVDDHVDTLQVMARLLTRRGHQVLVAADCRSALETAREHRFDLVVSDLGLPDGSGLTLLAQLREICDAPAIALSGYGMEEDVRQSRLAGYDEHLTKPIDFPLLNLTIGKLLAAGRR